MSEDSNVLLESMRNLLAKAGSSSSSAQQSWAPAPPTSVVQGVGVPVRIPRGRGTIRITLLLPADCAASPAALTAALDQLESVGIPLDVWEPKDSSWGGGSSGSRWRK